MCAYMKWPAPACGFAVSNYPYCFQCRGAGALLACQPPGRFKAGADCIRNTMPAPNDMRGSLHRQTHRGARRRRRRRCHAAAVTPPPPRVIARRTHAAAAAAAAVAAAAEHARGSRMKGLMRVLARTVLLVLQENRILHPKQHTAFAYCRSSRSILQLSAICFRGGWVGNKK